DKLKLWEVATGKEVRLLGEYFSWGFFLPGPGRVLAGRKIPRIIDLRSGREAGRIAWTSQGYTDAVALSPNGKRALFYSTDLLVLWDLERGEEIRTLQGPGAEGPAIIRVFFSRDRKTVLSATEKALSVWDVASGQCLKTLKDTDPKSKTSHIILGSAVSPDGKYAVIRSLVPTDTGSKSVLKLWDVTTGKIVRRLSDHKDQVSCVAFSPDGRFVLSYSNPDWAEGEYLWDFAESTVATNALLLWEVKTGQLVRRFEGQKDRTYWLEFS